MTDAAQLATARDGAYLQERSFEFITFIYAASVHLVIHHSANPHVETRVAWLASALVVFFLSDWLSRVRLPQLIVDRPSLTEHLTKTLLEVGGLFFLATGALALLDARRGDVHDAQKLASLFFGGFLLCTFLWNLAMIRVMKKVKWLEIVTSTFLGLSFHMKAAHDYLFPFKQRVAGLLAALEKARNGSGGGRVELGAHAVCALKIGCLKTIVQYIAFHLALANLIAALLLLADGLAPAGTEVVLLVQFRSAPIWIWPAALLIAPIIIFLFAADADDSIRTGTTGKVLSGLGGLLTVLLPSLVYVSIGSERLIYWMCGQQLVASLFLQYAGGTPPQLLQAPGEHAAPTSEQLTATAPAGGQTA